MGGNIDCPEIIKNADVRPEIPVTGGTVILIQRHEEYIRNEDDPRLGHLENKAAFRAREQATKIFGEIIEQIPEEERDKVDVLIVASDTQKSTGQRCMETAQETMDGVKTVLYDKGLSKSQLLNTHEGRFRGKNGPRPTAQIREPKIFTDSPEFVSFLETKYGTGQSFWIAFENDVEQVTRKTMEAEGPWELAERLHKFVGALARYSEHYHRENPGRRLIVWVVTHYDTISPYVKRYLADVDREKYLPVDYGGGFSINIQPDGSASTVIGNIPFVVSTGHN